MQIQILKEILMTMQLCIPEWSSCKKQSNSFHHWYKDFPFWTYSDKGRMIDWALSHVHWESDQTKLITGDRLPIAKTLNEFLRSIQPNDGIL